MTLQTLWGLCSRAVVPVVVVGMITSAAAAQASKTDKAVRDTPLKQLQPLKTPQDDDKHPGYIDGSLVILQGLDKETARIQTFGGKVGSVVTFRTLQIVIRRCQKTPPQMKPEKAAFLQIYDVNPESKKKKMVFSGWMFASSPALSAMDHPTYDIWLKDCR